MKTFPQNWNTREVIFFAGVLASVFLDDHTFDELRAHIEESRRENPDAVLLFVDLVERLEPLMGDDPWKRAINRCSELFCLNPAIVSGGNHAK